MSQTEGTPTMQFRVHVRQWVETIATVTIHASSKEEAIAEAYGYEGDNYEFDWTLTSGLKDFVVTDAEAIETA
jgi:type IV secretory pathway TrbF-like protein